MKLNAIGVSDKGYRRMITAPRMALNRQRYPFGGNQEISYSICETQDQRILLREDINQVADEHEKLVRTEQVEIPLSSEEFNTLWRAVHKDDEIELATVLANSKPATYFVAIMVGVLKPPLV